MVGSERLKPLSDLIEECKYREPAILELIMRLGDTHGTGLADLQAQEFDMVFWWNVNRWERSWHAFNKDNLYQTIQQIQKDHPGSAIMVVHHKPHYPIPATYYSNEGLWNYINELNREWKTV